MDLPFLRDSLSELRSSDFIWSSLCKTFLDFESERSETRSFKDYLRNLKVFSASSLKRRRSRNILWISLSMFFWASRATWKSSLLFPNWLWAFLRVLFFNVLWMRGKFNWLPLLKISCLKLAIPSLFYSLMNPYMFNWFGTDLLVERKI